MVNISLTISGVLAILVGILILIWPKILNYAVAFYLLVVGVLQLINI